ncbi:MAG: hypothetical protein LWX01_05040 [Deltaproteobacteria bacterium]|nr:hypothetical protein [Deltaproteobacteria bacterium]MDL1961053.1 hypothetical protein [Deltaproteobacteria bacterium]
MKIQAIEITNRGQRQSCFCTNIGIRPAGHCPMAGELTGIAGEFMDALFEVLEEVQIAAHEK